MIRTALLLVLILITGCTALQDLASIQKPKLSVGDVNVTDLSLQDLELTFDIDIDNPNQVGINLASYNYDFLVDENSFVQGSQPLSTEIKAKNSKTIQVPVRFTFQELYNTFSDIKDKDQSTYELDAIIEVDLPVLGLTEIPLNKSDTFPILKAPKISASALRVKSISFTKADLELELNIDNPNSFDISVDDLNYSVDINGLKSLTGQSNSVVNITKKSTGTINIPISLNFLEVGRTAYNILKNDEPITYSLEGSALFDTSLPIFKTSDFDFDKTGTVNIFNN